MPFYTQAVFFLVLGEGAFYTEFSVSAPGFYHFHVNITLFIPLTFFPLWRPVLRTTLNSRMLSCSVFLDADSDANRGPLYHRTQHKLRVLDRDSERQS